MFKLFKSWRIPSGWSVMGQCSQLGDSAPSSGCPSTSGTGKTELRGWNGARAEHQCRALHSGCLFGVSLLWAGISLSKDHSVRPNVSLSWSGKGMRHKAGKERAPSAPEPGWGREESWGCPGWRGEVPEGAPREKFEVATALRGAAGCQSRHPRHCPALILGKDLFL